MKQGHFALFFLSGAFGFLLSACGFPTYTFFYHPYFSSPSAYMLTITHDVRNYDIDEGANQSFKGYEVFYRIYSNSDEAIAKASSLATMASTYAGNPDSFMNYALNTLNFLCIRLASADSQPLAALSASAASSDHTFYIYLNSSTINFNNTTDWLLNDGSNYYPLRRSIAETSRSAFQVQSNYKSSVGDVDYNGIDSPSTIYLVFFAVAYGTDPTSPGVSVYSEPEFPTGTAVSSGVVAYNPGL